MCGEKKIILRKNAENNWISSFVFSPRQSTNTAWFTLCTRFNENVRIFAAGSLPAEQLLFIHVLPGQAGGTQGQLCQRIQLFDSNSQSMTLSRWMPSIFDVSKSVVRRYLGYESRIFFSDESSRFSVFSSLAV